MPLPTSGPLSLSQVNTELGRASNATISLGEAAVRALAGVPSGPIGKASLRGKANAFGHTITANQLHLNLRTYLLGQGWNGTTAVQVTIAPGVYIWSDNTSVPALDMGGAFPGGLTLINNGFIMGKGGDGGYLTSGRASYMAPTTGGPAITLTGPISINNTNGYIGGGGGGGAGATGAYSLFFNATEMFSPGGGGAGGGRGGPANNGTNTGGTTIGGFGEGGAIGQIGSVASGNPWPGQTIAIHGGAGGAAGAVIHGASGGI